MKSRWKGHHRDLEIRIRRYPIRKRILNVMRWYTTICGSGLSATELAYMVRSKPASVSSLLCRMAKSGVITRLNINGTWRYSK